MPVDGFLPIDKALSLVEVYRAVQILVNSTSSLDLGVWRSGQELPAPPLIRQPDVNRSRASFIGRTVTGLALDGNAFWRVYSRNGQVTGVSVVNPLLVSIRFDAQRRKWFDVMGDKGVTSYSEREMVHLRLLEIPGHDRGLGPIQASRAAIRGALDMRNYGSQWFTDSGVPTGVLSTDQELDPEQAAEYREAWSNSQRQRQTAVLGRGLSYEAILLNPEDAQFIQSQQFTKTQIATLFGVPPTFLNAAVEGSNLTYTNAQQVNAVFWQTTLSGYLTAIADGFTSLLPRGQEVRFKGDSLLRADDTSRIANKRVLADMGAISPTEVRLSEGFTGPAPSAPSPVEPSEEQA